MWLENLQCLTGWGSCQKCLWWSPWVEELGAWSTGQSLVSQVRKWDVCVGGAQTLSIHTWREHPHMERVATCGGSSWEATDLKFRAIKKCSPLLYSSRNTKPSLHSHFKGLFQLSLWIILFLTRLCPGSHLIRTTKHILNPHNFTLKTVT